MKPTPLREVLPAAWAFWVASGLREVADYVMRTGHRVHVPGVVVFYRKRRKSGVVGGKRYGARYSLSATAVKATRRAKP